MAQTIKLKRSSTPNNVPTTGQLELGEVAINTYDGKLYIKKDNGTASIVEVGLQTPTSAVYSKYSYTATASQTTFSGTDDNSNTLAYFPGYVEVYLNGIKLLDTVEYTATNGSSIVLAAGASADDVLEVIAMGSASLEQLIVTRGFDSFIYTATASQTTFSGNDDNSNSLSYTVNQIQVFLNGVLLDSSDYTASNGTSVVITAGTLANDIVTILAYNVDSLDSLGDLSITGNLTVAGTVTADGLSLGDNEKATFGASNDLEIYHDGSASFITDTGTGNLRVQGTNLALQNAAGTKNYLLGVDGGSTSAYFNNDLKLATTSTGIDVNSSGNTTASISAGTDTSSSNIFFGDTADSNAGYILYNHSDDSMSFRTNGSGEDMRIDASGNLLVGKTSAGSEFVGVQATATGQLAVTRDGGIAQIVNRLTSDGTLVDFRKDNTTVGSIGADSGKMYLGTNNIGLLFDVADNIQPYHTGNNVTTDGVADIGSAAARFKDAHFSGTVNANAFIGDGSALTNLPSSGGVSEAKVYFMANS